MSNNLGKTAEDRVARHLVAEGYLVLGRNRKIAGVEVDILAKKANHFYLFEVKQRSSHRLADCALSDKQLARLRRAARSIKNLQSIQLATVVKGEVTLFEII